MTKKILCFFALILILAMNVGCSTKQNVSVEFQSSVDAMTEGMLQGFNADNYTKFSEYFDQKMKGSFSEEKFETVNRDIKEKIGNYISKEFVAAENKDEYKIFIYKGKFDKESNDVIIRTVVSDNDGSLRVSGFWLDSPNLRK